ncbi:MAG: SdiA-regulated domain-containing protein [Flavisolibacter sp.]
MKKFIQTKCPLSAICIVYAVTLLAGCNLQSYETPAGYDISKPQKSELGKVLNEISGISYNANDSSLLAISDSKRKVFEISLTRKRLRDYTKDIFPGNQDLEDIVNLEHTLYVMSSKGLLYEVPLNDEDTLNLVEHSFWSADKNDFESLYLDEEANGLIMLCKSCEADKGKQQRSAYRFDLQTKQFDTTAYYIISTTEVKSLMKDEDAKFDPSAARIHPINKKLYILSSAGNLLVITDTRGKPLEAFNLNPDDHPQAEGLAFSPNGDMYITNEGKYGTPTLQVFPFLVKKK